MYAKFLFFIFECLHICIYTWTDMNKGNILNISESVHFHRSVKGEYARLYAGSFWITKTPNKNYLAGFWWLWGNTFFFVSVLSYVKSAILLASVFYATSGYVSFRIFTNFYGLVIDFFFFLLNVKHEVFTIMLCILPTVAKTQEPFFD